MITVLVAVRDQKGNNFTQPVAQPSRGIALRSWTDELNNPKNADLPQCKHPEDFSLWYLGNYDDQTGEITPLKPCQMAVASDLIKNT